jgi:hypothetical protein
MAVAITKTTGERMLRSAVIAIVCASVAANAQGPSNAAAIPSADEQITQAVLPLPNDLRATASVLGYGPDGKFVALRNGTGGMTCLANNPQSPRFHVACYHKSMEPFMARGRELRTQGVQGDQVDSVRFREAREGKIKLPTQPSVLYSLTGAKDAYDAATKTAKATPLFVVYMPYATSETTGLSAIPARGTPWVMNAGTPKAHIMFVPSMSP